MPYASCHRLAEVRRASRSIYTKHMHKDPAAWHKCSSRIADFFCFLNVYSDGKIETDKKTNLRTEMCCSRMFLATTGD